MIIKFNTSENHTMQVERVGMALWLLYMSTSHTVGCGSRPDWVMPKTIIKTVQTAFLHGTHVLG